MTPTLQPATVQPLLDEWSSHLPTPWTDQQTGRVTQLLTELSHEVTPHVVQDTPLTDDQLQDILLHRLTIRLEDWLAAAAATQRRLHGDTAPRLQPESTTPALGLNSATNQEIEDLPGLDDVLTERIARYLALHPQTADLDRLEAVNGVGPQRLAQLQKVAYIDQPRPALLSPALYTFLQEPSIPHFLNLLDRTDLSFFYGDQNTATRRHGPGHPSSDPATADERFEAFLEFVLAQTRKGSTLMDGVLASRAHAQLQRVRTLQAHLQNSHPAAGDVILNADYVAAATQAIDDAQDSIQLMMFLGTTAPADTPDGAAPLTLVEAMEAAAGRGVDVRVILDQDDRGVPYKSFFINQALVKRFEDNGINVRFDTEDTLLHSKLLITDETTTVLGSHNWTRTSLNESHEASVLLNSPALAAEFSDRFDDVWTELPTPN
jgi:DNA uptake protein ComE-like DNA-binding protein